MKKSVRVLILLLLVITTFGCTQYIKEDNKTVVYEKTGQTLASNILCKPLGDEMYNFYKEHEAALPNKLDDLPACNEFTPGALKYVSIWETIFVKPLAFLILKLGELLGNYGFSVIVMSLLIRILMIPLTKKSMNQQEDMKKAQPEIQKIEKKYSGKTDQQSMMAKSQETMMVYKKYHINPISSCLTAFLQIPLFLGFLEAINRVPAIFEGNIFGGIFEMGLGMTPIVGIQQGKYIYILIIVLIILSTYLSFRLTMKNQPDNPAMGSTKTMMIVMLIMISIASINLPTAIALYWIASSMFVVIQGIISKKLKERRK